MVQGAVPKDLTGVFVRTGPNPQFKPHGRYHWCDILEPILAYTPAWTAYCAAHGQFDQSAHLKLLCVCYA